MTAAVQASNDAFIARASARREVWRLRRNKKKVPQDLLERAGYSNGAPMSKKQSLKQTIRTVAKDPLKTTTTLEVQGSTAARQALAKELEIKNRRWMTVAELDEAIALAQKRPQTPGDQTRLTELQEIGRKRCRTSWEAWKQKNPAKATTSGASHE